MAAHHLLDIIDVSESFSAGLFAAAAREAIKRIRGTGKTPIVCGGTGFYIEALCSPMFEEPEVDPARKKQVRAELARDAETLGRAEIHRRLEAVDPQSAARLHPNDLQRVSRALEVYCLTGRTLSELHGEAQTKPDFAPYMILLDPPLDEHDRRIAERTGAMFDAGWEVEVRDLLAGCVPEDAPGFESLGYAEIISLVRGRTGRDEAAANIVRSTCRYARRQRTWFNTREAALRDDPRKLSIGDIESGWRKYQHKQGEGTG